MLIHQPLELSLPTLSSLGGEGGGHPTALRRPSPAGLGELQLPFLHSDPQLLPVQSPDGTPSLSAGCAPTPPSNKFGPSVPACICLVFGSGCIYLGAALALSSVLPQTDRRAAHINGTVAPGDSVGERCD